MAAHPTHMKAVRVHRFGGPEVLQLETDVAVPTPGPKQVLVRVVCAGVNPVETYIHEGQYSTLPQLPYTPGTDAAGVIVAVGDECVRRDVSVVGQRVFVTGRRNNSGAYAEYLATDEEFVFPLHSRLSFAQGAALGTPYFTAYRALVLGARTRPGENVLVHGASGAAGTAAVQIARWGIGANVVGTAGTKEGMDVVASCGAHCVVNHNDKGYEKTLLEYLGATGNSGFDVIIEHLANVNLGQDVQMMGKGARVMVVGCRGTVTLNPRALMAPEASIRGVSLSSSKPAEWKEMGAGIAAGVEAGWVKPVIDKEYGLAEVAQVHHDIIHSKGAKGKLVLKVTEE